MNNNRASSPLRAGEWIIRKLALALVHTRRVPKGAQTWNAKAKAAWRPRARNLRTRDAAFVDVERRCCSVKRCRVLFAAAHVAEAAT